MAFAVVCKSCQARFLLNDDLLRRKVAGKVVTVRCRQCHATIEVDASDVDPESLPGIPAAAPLAASPAKPRAPRPAPPPPRPGAKSTLMGIGAPRPAGATELVALSPGFLDVKPAPAVVASPHGFPEPPPPPDAVEVLDPGDWEEAPPSQPEEAAPESLDDFAEELPPSVPPEEEMPSSTGTPSLKALTHHDEQSNKPRVDDFLTNMTAAMNGGIMTGAPTIDVSGLATGAQPPATNTAPSIDVSSLETPVRGAKTLPLFSGDDDKFEAARPGPAVTSAPSPAEGSLSPAALDRPAADVTESEGPRERKNVVAPATRSVPPAAASRKPSGLAAPLLLALAAAAGFLIWKRSAAHAPAERVEAERPAEQASAPPAAPAEATPAQMAEPAGLPSAEPPVADDISFETTPNKPASNTPAAAATPLAAKPPAANEPKSEPAPAVAMEEPKPEPAAEPTPPAEPAGPFDKAAATAALTASVGQASACRKEGDPSGVASVVVTFAPSGRVTSANISGPPFAGTPTGGCIASTLRKTRIPAFDGERVTVSKTVVIQ